MLLRWSLVLATRWRWQIRGGSVNRSEAEDRRKLGENWILTHCASAILKNVKVQKKVKVLTDTYEHMRYHVRKSAFPRVQNATRILLLLRFSTFMKKLVFKKTIIGQKHNFSGHFFYYYVKLKLSK